MPVFDSNDAREDSYISCVRGRSVDIHCPGSAGFSVDIEELGVYQLLELLAALDRAGK
jgi:hypothetical protein